MDWESLLAMLGPSSAQAGPLGGIGSDYAAGLTPPPLPGMDQANLDLLNPKAPYNAPAWSAPPSPGPQAGIGSDYISSGGKGIPSLGTSLTPLGELDPTGGMTVHDYGGGVTIPPTATPTVGGPVEAGGPYGGSPATNPNLKPLSGAPPGANVGNALTNALRGVTVPKPPTPQHVSTPAAPRPSAAIHSGELQQLLQMLSVAGRANQGGLQLPSTLGAALGGK